MIQLIRSRWHTSLTDSEKSTDVAMISQQPTLDLPNRHSDDHARNRMRQYRGQITGSAISVTVEVNEDTPGRKSRRIVVSAKLSQETTFPFLSINRFALDAELECEAAEYSFIEDTFDGASDVTHSHTSLE